MPRGLDSLLFGRHRHIVRRDKSFRNGTSIFLGDQSLARFQSNQMDVCGPLAGVLSCFTQQTNLRHWVAHYRMTSARCSTSGTAQQFVGSPADGVAIRLVHQGLAVPLDLVVVHS